MYYKFRKPDHRWAISTFVDLENNRVLRGPFYKKRSIIEQNKYQRINFLLSQNYYVPEIFKKENEEYLNFPLSVKSEISLIGSDKGNNLIDCLSDNFNWEKSSFDEKILCVKNLFLRFIINSGEGSLSNLIMHEGNILQLGLDIPKFKKSSTIVELIFSENLDRLFKEKTGTFIYHNILLFKTFLDSIIQNLNSEELENCQILQQMLDSKNLVRSEYDINYEAEKGKRGPKPKPKQFKESLSQESKNKSIPLKLNYENCPIPLEAKTPKLTLNLGDFINAWNYYQERDNLLEFCQEVYKFMFEYLSAEDWLNSSYGIFLELEKCKLSNIINIYHCLSKMKKTQELFKLGMENTFKLKAKISKSSLYALDIPDFLKKIISILPFYTRYAYILLKKVGIQSFNLEKIENVKKNITLSTSRITQNMPLSWVEVSKLVYNSLMSGNLKKDAGLRDAGELFENTHIGFLANNKKIEKECLRLKAFQLPIQPGTLLAIYS